MSPTKLRVRMERLEKGNAGAAIIILSDPERYNGLLLEWAMAFAYRMVTTTAGRYPALERLWARSADQAKFPGPRTSGGDGLHEEHELPGLPTG